MLGSNVPTIGGLAVAFEHAQDWACACIQVYTTRSRQWSVPPMKDDEIAAFLKARSASCVQEVVAHVPFLVNLASPDADRRAKAIDRLTIELSRAQQLGIGNIVLHPGSAGAASRPQGIRWIVAGLNEVLRRVDANGTKILLENMAGQGTQIGSFFEDLSEIISGVEARDRVGVCFDTAHAFICGYRLYGYDGYHQVFDEFDRIVGLKWIKVVHLNDAKTRLGSRHDRHAAVGEGHMGLCVFHALLNDARFSSLPKILEIPERDEKSARTLVFLRELGSRPDPILESKDTISDYTQMLLPGIRA